MFWLSFLRPLGGAGLPSLWEPLKEQVHRVVWDTKPRCPLSPCGSDWVGKVCRRRQAGARSLEQEESAREADSQALHSFTGPLQLSSVPALEIPWRHFTCWYLRLLLQLQRLSAAPVPVSNYCPCSFRARHIPAECLLEMATHSSILAWRISWTGDAGGLPSMGQRVGHNWVTNTDTMH